MRKWHGNSGARAALAGAVLCFVPIWTKRHPPLTFDLNPDLVELFLGDNYGYLLNNEVQPCSDKRADTWTGWDRVRRGPVEGMEKKKKIAHSQGKGEK